MFKKMALLVLLIALVVAVSYYKTTLQDASLETAYNDGQVDAGQQIDQLQKATDSLSGELEAKEFELAETRATMDTIRVAQTDSLVSVIQSRENELAELSESQKTNAPPVIATKTDSTSSRHLEILVYYKKMFRALPKDLSAYERRIALSEIREESANKFKISVAELNRIRKDNDLSY